HVPARYEGLGLAPDAAISHAAWDPGAEDLAIELSKTLDAPLVAGLVSRLVYDCNRPPEAPDAMPERSELFEIPGNRNLTAMQKNNRIETVYHPFHAAVSGVLAQRKARGDLTVLVTIHSFTPVYFGKPRKVEIGILHDSDGRMADAMMREAARLPHRAIARNDPYGAKDGVTHTLKLHGVKNRLPNVMIEVRNDLLTTPRGVSGMRDELLKLIVPALPALKGVRAAHD
ncbi:MAG: N-formylglutamate amidohydrolase, partial [Pseudomonadota bacterium]